MTTDECIALTDDELVDATYRVVDELTESTDERTAHAGGSLIFLFGELLERLVPELAQAHLVRSMTASQTGPLEAQDEHELLEALDGLRRRQAARMLRDALSDVGTEAPWRGRETRGFRAVVSRGRAYYPLPQSPCRIIVLHRRRYGPQRPNVRHSQVLAFEWAVPGSNQRPPACKAGALPTELTARGS